MSENFNMGALEDWAPVSIGEVLRFELPSAGYRQADFQLMADCEVSVIASARDGRAWLVAVGSGLLAVKFSMQEEIWLSVAGPDNGSVFIKTKIGAQALVESGEPTFTDIEPRRMSASDKITRVQEIMAANAQKRMAALMEGIEAQQRALDEKLALIEKAEPAPVVVSDGAA